MTDRPILFSAPMVRAILDWQKTQTRRVMKPQPPKPEEFFGSDFGLSRSIADGLKMYSLNDHPRLPKHPTDWDLVGSVGVARDAGRPQRYRCPYGQPSDRLWVRETWGMNHYQFEQGPIPKARPADFDEPDSNYLVYRATEDDTEVQNELRWWPSIHMPRWASRILLEITEIRVERLNDCSEADALAEGSQHPSLVPIVGAGWSSRDMYARLWEQINGAGSWASNPWVWVVEFKRVQP